jgi:uncharacterized protein with PIN domain
LLQAEIVPFDADQAHAAQVVYMGYGKGIHPTARLNLCDCVAYALAKQFGVPLLFKGDDFKATDIGRVSDAVLHTEIKKSAGAAWQGVNHRA